jgi:hypothetical protein
MTTRETDAAGEIMMPVSAADAARGIEITVLRQMGDNIAAQTRQMERFVEKVDDIQVRVIRLEEQKTSKMVERVEAELRAALAASQADVKAALSRIESLERQRDREAGAMSVWAWLSKNAPWLFAAVATFFAGLAVKAGLVK